MRQRAFLSILSVLGVLLGHAVPVRAAPLAFEDGPQAIFAAKCLACHGPDRTKRKAELDLQSARSILAGGESGPAVTPGKAAESLLWQALKAGEMPPEGEVPLTAEELRVVEAWIADGARSGQAAAVAPAAECDFWSFRHLQTVEPRTIEASVLPAGSQLDALVWQQLQQHHLSFAREADKNTLVRRVYLDLIGLPPTAAEVTAFVSDDSADAYPRLVDRLLQSPHYGEHWGRQWLDVVGYADSNGYIRFDTLRPLAYHYRDYVIRSLNGDKPYDQFWVEQLAGDELVDHASLSELSPQDRDCLIATHFLRNAPDGTDDTEGNAMTQTMERYAVLEAQLQITMSAMFGLTIDCARCHSHKFDPIPQRDYYSLQAIFYPAFNVKAWVQPKNRWIYDAGQAQVASWRTANDEADRETTQARGELERWIAENKPAGNVLWRDDFSSPALEDQWSTTAPGDDGFAGNPPLQLDGSAAPAARIDNGRLALLSAPAGDSKWLVTKSSFNWAPDRTGDWIQVTFDLVASQGADGKPAQRIGYYIALRDYDDSADAPPGAKGVQVGNGNILFDGNPAGGAQVELDYPGADHKQLGTLGASRYEAGHNYGVRISRQTDDYLVEHLVDGKVDGQPLRMTDKQLAPGGFGFELCCGRNFVVDNVVIEGSPATQAAESEPSFAAQVEEKKRELTATLAKIDSQRMPEPAKLAWVTDLSETPPDVCLLKRGDYFQPGSAVEPGPLSILTDVDNLMSVSPPASGSKTTGCRLAFARWATRPDSRAAALLARVQADRIWRGHFGQGLVPTPENFGLAGVTPTHPELLEWLAGQLVRSGWRLKPLHREIVLSRCYRQAATAEPALVGSDLDVGRDPENRFYSRFPAHRLPAESIRDSMLAVSGTINLALEGPPVAVSELANRQVVAMPPDGTGPHQADRRSIYLRYRRSQPLWFLRVFDQPAPEPNCLARATSTVVGQSLALINGEFAVRSGRQFAARLAREAPDSTEALIRLAFQSAFAREPSAAELRACAGFIDRQTEAGKRQGRDEPAREALADLCRTLLASNEFLYIQ